MNIDKHGPRSLLLTRDYYTSGPGLGVVVGIDVFLVVIGGSVGITIRRGNSISGASLGTSVSAPSVVPSASSSSGTGSKLIFMFHDVTNGSPTDKDQKS